MCKTKMCKNQRIKNFFSHEIKNLQYQKRTGMKRIDRTKQLWNLEFLKSKYQ